jgi:sulfide:quinone oxidoreductase
MCMAAKSHKSPVRALVVGGGFAGVEAAIQLRKRGIGVTLVSDRPFLHIYPLSIWIPTGESPADTCRLDLADLARRHGFDFELGSIGRIEASRKAVVVDGLEKTADVLVLAMGGVPLRPTGVEHTVTIGGAPDNATRAHERLMDLVARGSGRIAMGFGGNPKDPSAVRGGPMFELMFNVDHLLRKRGLRDRFELTFFAPMSSPGERMGRKATDAVQALFDKREIKKKFGTKIAGFDERGVLFEDGTRLDADLTVFLPAQGGHPAVKSSDLPVNEAGFVQIDEGCAVRGMPGVYAVGDVAAIDGPPWRAKQGHLAEVMARVAADNVLAESEGRPERESYIPHVSITCLMDMGRGAALVHRDQKGEKLIPLPGIGHWAKKAWGAYFKASKKRQVPRLPGM